MRFRHTDSDFFRLARQQEFVRSFKEQVAKNFDVGKLPGIISTVTRNVEIAGNMSDTTVMKYAKFAATLPGGHFFQHRITNVSGYAELHAASSDVQNVVSEFANPDVTVAKVATATALGKKIKSRTPPPQQTSIVVLNGNGVAGAAANANYLLARLRDVYELPYDRLCMHEFVLSARNLKRDSGITALDVAKGLMDRGINQINSGNLQAALATYTELVKLAPDFAEAWNKRATVYYLLENYDASEKDIQKTLQLEPFHFGALSGRGLVKLGQRDFVGARNAYHAVLEVYPAMEGIKREIEQLDELLKQRSI